MSDIDLTPRDYKVTKGKRREPIFNWEYVWPALGIIASLAVAKIAFLWSMGKI